MAEAVFGRPKDRAKTSSQQPGLRQPRTATSHRFIGIKSNEDQSPFISSKLRAQRRLARRSARARSRLFQNAFFRNQGTKHAHWDGDLQPGAGLGHRNHYQKLSGGPV